MMPIERESALQPAAKLREMREPATVSRKLITVVQSVSKPDSLQREIGERRRRFTDREARMSAALEQYDVVPEHGEYARKE